MPDTHDVLVCEDGEGPIGQGGGIVHFGFRFRNPADIDLAVRTVENAGGRVLRHGEFVPGDSGG